MKRRYFIPVLSLSLCIFSLTAFLAANNEKAAETIAPAREKKVIIVDAGHGGVDGGATGCTGTIEKNVNLNIAKKLQKELQLLGFTVVMTRETDVSIHDPKAATIRQKKASDLKNRLELTRIYPDSILISIHQNAINIPSVRGAEVYYSPNDPSSKVFAQLLQDELNRVSFSAPRKINKAGSNLYLFHRAKNTAVLVECGFLTNREEEQLLLSDEYQSKLVDTIVKSLIIYLKDV